MRTEFKVKITVKIATADGAMIIIDTTMTIAIVGATIGLEEFRGLTNRSGIWKWRGEGPGELPTGISPTGPRFFSSLRLRLMM